MTLIKENDRYKIIWFTHILNAVEAREWCYQLWQNNWGRAMFQVPNQLGMANHSFIFHNFTHATWFMMKFNSI